ncbi:hypothetical protein BYT27DRAFT_7082055 [Phlegmacium glaucopus]|nr:hypothetical protein BYT27DRAFT_7082055 [Phlegmacium glaucopus]
MLSHFYDHHCHQCEEYVSVLAEIKPKVKTIYLKNQNDQDFSTSKPVLPSLEHKSYKDFSTSKPVLPSLEHKNDKDFSTLKSVLSSKFPPDPPSASLIEKIVKGFCKDTIPNKLVEGGCTVCGQLVPLNNMLLLTEIDCDLNILSPGNIGQHERLHTSDPILLLKGPILAENCQHICKSCQTFLKKGKKPPQSLANSFCIGAVPLVLQDLTFAEKMLISRIQHNRCLV